MVLPYQLPTNRIFVCLQSMATEQLPYYRGTADKTRAGTKQNTYLPSDYQLWPPCSTPGWQQ